VQHLHPIEQLFAKLDRIIPPYPPRVIPVPDRILGTAFFPGGSGLWNTIPGKALPTMPTGKIMILGQDFDSEQGFKRSRDNFGENLNGPTWRNLRTLLKDANIRLEDCFFTNLFMGLRTGSRNTGRFPGAGDEKFVGRCLSFLQEQIAVQQPSLILTLGCHVPPLLAQLSDDLASWRSCKKLSHLNSLPFIRNVHFDICPELQVTVAAFVHPSFRYLNVVHRKHGKLEGAEAESAILEEALQVSGLI
jgi:uracil-DNA glycosylase